MSPEIEQKLKEEFTVQLRAQYVNGLTVGAKSMCKVIMDKITKENASLDDIIKFCKTSLGEK